MFCPKCKHYAGFKYFVNIFEKFLQKKKNTLILKILKISQNAEGRKIAKQVKFLSNHSAQRNGSKNFIQTL